MKNTSLKNIKRSIGSSESEKIEWKPSVSQIKDIIETISAFANTHGGKICIGISDDGQIKGIKIGKSTIESLTNKIHQNLDPQIHPRISIKEFDSKEIILIQVKESLKKTILAYGRPYKRVGKSTIKMSQEEYEHLILNRHSDKLQFDSQISKTITSKDIESKALKNFLRTAKEERGLDISLNASILDTLKRLELVNEKNHFTNASVLLFGKSPSKTFIQSKIRCGRMKGNEGYDFIDMKVFDGTIIELREQAMAFILKHIKHAVFFDANQRHDRWEYPIRALEEMLTNALAHRDYVSNGDIQVFIYDNRIECRSPGFLPEPLSPEDLTTSHVSVPRNKLLAKNLFLIKYIERWGTGTNRIITEMKEHKLPKPKFEHIGGGFQVTLPGPGKAFEKEIEKKKLSEFDVNERQTKAIDYIQKNGKINRSEYIKINDISETLAKRELNKLLEKNIIRRRGGGRSTYYELAS